MSIINWKNSFITKITNKFVCDKYKYIDNGKNFIIIHDKTISFVKWDEYIFTKEKEIRNLTYVKLHREDGPAIISYYNGNIVSRIYCINNKVHRINKPAIILYDENGNIYLEHYYIEGINQNKYFDLIN